MIRTILVDDERPALKNLERLLKGYDYIEIVGAYTDITKAFEEIKKEKVHLIFLDIEMPKMKGIEGAEKILEIDKDIQIVFVTAYNDYAVDAFEVDAIDYVMKPVLKRRLDKSLERVLKRNKHMIELNKNKEENKILCFGNFEIIGNEKSIKWRTSKAKELAAYLVHNRGKFVHKSKIIEELWQYKEEEQATKLLHTNIYYVRSGLKSINLHQGIMYSNEMYRFHMDTMFLDIEEFEKIFNGNIEINSENEQLLKETIQLYRGEYLEENDYYWAKNEQERFSKIYMNILRRISDFYMGEGKYSEAIPYLKGILKRDPYIEEIHEKLLRIYVNIKDYTNFKEHYKSISKDFKRELGIDLSAATKELYENYIYEIEKIKVNR
ncbi:MAG: response regulator [Anaeromicrobium sp.]|uniref:response regulator n=1 Tax=Anaeromicrobium sp. TaxID=1929132 RepID=UPI0025DF6E45|nr:response regulator [Anaeromicrobium sp.]MCT4595979.1 response regulator [Anaeromicrobium sp.]